MNWSVIVLGLVALSSVAIAENSYLVIVPKLLKVNYDNEFSVFIAAAPQPVELKWQLTIGQQLIEGTTTIKAGETRNATITIPREFPVGPGELAIFGNGGIRFEERRDVIVYDNRYVVLVQTSASTYRPGDIMEVRVVATNEELTPVESGEVLIEFYDANLKLVAEFPRVPIRSGLTETFEFPISEHCNFGTWLVSATIANTTSSVEVLVARPVTPSFDLKAIFQRFLLRTDKTLRGVIEIDSDDNEPIFGRATMAIGQITELDVEKMMKEQRERVNEKSPLHEQPEKVNEQWRKWKSQQFDVAGRIEINYDLLSLFGIDVTKALAIQVYIQVTELASGQERFIQHVIPIFTRDVIYDIRPLEFEAGVKNEFEIIAKRPDGKPAKMEDLIVTVTMMLGNEEGKVQEEKSIEIKDFYTRGRTDIGLFNLEIPEKCIGVLMTITPLSEDGKVRGYRTHAIPLMPTPRRGVANAKLSIELLPSTMQPVKTDAKLPVVSSQISTVGYVSNFYVQLLPWKPVEKFEPLPMSFLILTNGRITRTGEFMLHPTKECRTKARRAIMPEEQAPPVCVFNGTLPIEITREMMPYSTLLVYTLRPSFGFSVAQSYRFSVAGLFQEQLWLNATIVPYTSTNALPEDKSLLVDADSSESFDHKPVTISDRAQDKTRVELSFTGAPGSTVGLNVIEYDGVTQGLSNEITKERLLQYLTMYEHVPIVGMPTFTPSGEKSGIRTRRGDGVEQGDMSEPKEGESTMGERSILSEQEEDEEIENERIGYQYHYPIRTMVFGVNSGRGVRPIEGDDFYTTPNMGRLYGDAHSQRPRSHYRRRAMKGSGQYDVTVDENEYVVATSYPLVFKAAAIPPTSVKSVQDDVEVGHTQESRGRGPRYGTPSWYEKMNSKLSTISQEAFTFMQSGLAFMTDFSSLRVPADMKRVNLTKLFSQYRKQSTWGDLMSFDVRDQARVLLEQYMTEGDLTMLPPPIMLEEQARLGYYRSVFFNTSRIEAQGTGKVVLPRTKPYSTWLATGFSLNAKSGLSVAQPIRLPTNQGLFILANFPEQVQIDEHVLLAFGINNYLGKDLTNVIVRIRASADFDLIELNQPERVLSTNGKDYTLTIPSLKTWAVETRNITLVPKRAGVIKIILEVESEFGGDYELLTTLVRESGIKRKEISGRIFDLTSEKKSYGPIVEKINSKESLRSVRLSVSGTGLDRLFERYTTETNTLIGVDRAIIRMWRLLGLNRYLNETSRMNSPMFVDVMENITTTYQKLQMYSNYNGSFSFISDRGEQFSSLYLTSMTFGALISPFMPVRDNVTLNRTLTWILSRQQQDGSFDDDVSCLHYRFCSGEFRRESLTALVLYTWTRNNVSDYLPEYMRRVLFHGEQSPVLRAQRYLESRLDAVKPCLLTTTFVELALIQCPRLSEQLRQKIFANVRSRQLTVVPEDDSKYLKVVDERYVFEDQMLINSFTLSMYSTLGDWQTTSQIARWIVEQIETHPHFDTVLDGIFHTEAWLKASWLFRRRFGLDKFSVIVDVTADNGQKQQFKFDSTNMDYTQKFYFTLPVNQISYTVSGFGVATVFLRQIFVDQEQKLIEPTPFSLTNEFKPLPWFSEITTRTCLTYKPTPKDQRMAKDTFNRTIVVEFQLPSGMRINLRQIGFFLSRVPEVMYFSFDEDANKLNFFFNIGLVAHNKPICIEWCLERLSFVKSWKPVLVRVYDYLQPENQLIRLPSIQFQPSLVGYSYVDAVLQARPTIEELAKMQQPRPNRV